jgi:hypothetical protein
MARARVELSLEEELMILLFWAHGIDLARKLSQEQLQALPELKRAIDAVSGLPDVIGWGDKPRGAGRRFGKSQRTMPADRL